MLAGELRRRRVRPRSMADDLERVRRSTWIAGDLRAAPTSLLVLAALNLSTADEMEQAGETGAS